MYRTLIMKKHRLFETMYRLLPSNKEGKSGVLLQKRRMFSIMKVRYIITRNFFDNEPISKLFDVLKSWELALSNARVFSRKVARLSNSWHTWSWKSRFQTGRVPPPPNRNGEENNRINRFVNYGWSGIEKVTNEVGSYQVCSSYDHFRVYISNKNENAPKYLTT